MKSPNLAELQNSLQDFLLDKKTDASHLTLETPGFSYAQRLQIYHEAYRLRLIDALRNDYPALCLWLGEEIFEEIAIQYIKQHPSQDPSLRWLGKHLPTFLLQHPNWSLQIIAIELAQFEWAQIMAFDSTDKPTATIDQLRTFLPEQWMSMQLRFHESIQIVSLTSNAPMLWYSLIHSGATIDTEIYPQIQHWLIWRENLQVVYRPLETPEAWALNAFINQNNFEHVCSGLCDWFDEAQVPMHTAQFLQRWIQSELVVKILT